MLRASDTPILWGELYGSEYRSYRLRAWMRHTQISRVQAASVPFETVKQMPDTHPSTPPRVVRPPGMLDAERR